MRKQTAKRGKKHDHSLRAERIKLITALIGLLTAIINFISKD